MPDESEKSFEAALEIIKINISEKKNQIANDSDGKLVGKLLPEVEALQVLTFCPMNSFEQIYSLWCPSWKKNLPKRNNR